MLRSSRHCCLPTSPLACLRLSRAEIGQSNCPTCSSVELHPSGKQTPRVLTLPSDCLGRLHPLARTLFGLKPQHSKEARKLCLGMGCLLLLEETQLRHLAETRTQMSQNTHVPKHKTHNSSRPEPCRALKMFPSQELNK